MARRRAPSLPCSRARFYVVLVYCHPVVFTVGRYHSFIVLEHSRIATCVSVSFGASDFHSLVVLILLYARCGIVVVVFLHARHGIVVVVFLPAWRGIIFVVFLPARRGPSGKKFSVRMQGQRPGAADAQDTKAANWRGILHPDDACQRTGRSERHTPHHLPSGCEVSGHLTSGREVSGHLPSGCSAFLTDGECQGKFLPDSEGQGKFRLDDAWHGICHRDAKCQGICHPDAARSIQTESVKAKVVRTTCAMASTFWM